MEIKEINDDYSKFYTITEELGRGQFGKVFKCINKQTKEYRALKVIENDNNDNNITYIKSELNNMKICSDENNNALKYYECFHYNGKFIIVMELCDESLQTLLDKKKEGFTCEQIFNIMSQLNNTFKIMKKHNIIHRDIKLDNILVKYFKDNKDDSNINFVVKLTDFGISKQIINTIGKTNVGTSLNMAPEILEGKNNYDDKCDLWSIGIIIYQLFFREYPFKGRTQVAIFKNIEKFGNKCLKKTNNINLDNLIESLLERDPKKRINYEDYFKHPFFIEKINKHNKGIIFDKKDENINKDDFKNDEFEDNENNINISDICCENEKIEMNATKKIYMNIYISVCYCLEKSDLELNKEIIIDQNNYNDINKYIISKSELNKDKSLKTLYKDFLVREREDFTISCIEYAPKIFSYLRKIDKIKEEEMVISLLPMCNQTSIKDSDKKKTIFLFAQMIMNSF